MKNNKIAVKLFFITTAVFIAFISLTLIFQVFFFERYYEHKKQENFASDMVELSRTLGKGTMDETSIAESFKTFDEDNDSRTILVNIPEYNDSVTSGGIVDDSNYMFYAFDRKINSAVMAQLGREWTFFNRSTYLGTLLTDKKTYIYTKSFGKSSSIIGAAPVVINGAVNNVIFSIVSLQPVGDAVNTMKEFYIYIYLFAILSIFILSSIYSLMISKPLIKLKNAASKMTELDFSTKCEINTKDEIGELGNVLNFLSDKLDTTLTELQSSNEKLKEDIEKERQLEYMRKEFVAGVSHELKTPITLIGGYAEALKDNIAREEDKEFFVDVIVDESKKMEYIIRDMLELSQLEAGSLKMNMEEFNLSELVQGVLKKFSRSIDAKNVKVQASIGDAVSMVKGDPIRIEQVLVNLLSNAVKNVVDGGRLSVGIQTENNCCMVFIENEGSHIPEDEIDKVWERFYKVDKSRTREVEGTGIGLSIVKNILLLHHSAFGAQNTEAGVKFHFSVERVLETEEK